MLDFVFDNSRKQTDSAIVIIADNSKVLQNERLVKRVGKTIIESLLNALQAEAVNDESDVFIKTYSAQTPCLFLTINKKDPFKTGKTLYSKLKKYANADIYVGSDLDESFFEKMLIAMENENYSFDKYCTKKKAEDFDKLETVQFFGVKKPNMKKVAAITNAVRYARDLGNEPANRLTPYEFIKDVERLSYLDIDVEVLDETAMKEENFGLALAVAQGSSNSPYTAILKWKGNPNKEDFDCGLVGKGVIYDSGGLSLKSRSGLRSMKQDMSGAADVVSVIKAIALQRLPVNVVAVVTMVENMPSAHAYKVDDILTSMSGQTVEIIDTDAEGRLVLADSLWYIQKRFKVKTLIDIATLTGAAEVIFGGVYAAIFGNDDKLIQKLIKTGEYVNERLWPLPLNADYDKRMNSSIADMKNFDKPRMAVPSTAAAFLQRFVHKSTKWAHLDIGGCECDEKDKVSTGFGVMLLEDFIHNFVK
ncbi:MAG: leucyl aminopeptidase family protein [Alphaproteobacteria bacterium]|nr:leucyl aminopeptidase family protein [Alphaproteobacteria bacterium]